MKKCIASQEGICRNYTDLGRMQVVIAKGVNLKNITIP